MILENVFMKTLNMFLTNIFLISTSRNAKSWSLWLRYSCLCSSLGYLLHCARRFQSKTTQTRLFTRAMKLINCPIPYYTTSSWPMFLATPVWCDRWQRMWEAAYTFPQVRSGWKHKLILFKYCIKQRMNILKDCYESRQYTLGFRTG